MKKILFFGMAAVLAAGFTACKDDALSQSGKPLDSDQTFFMNIAVNSSAAMTRDVSGVSEDYDPTEEPEFDPGVEGSTENRVHTIYLVFYDENGNRVSTAQVLNGNTSSSVTGPTYDGLNPSENSLYQGVVQVDVAHGNLPPSYVLAFVNPIQSQSFEYNNDFSTLQKVETTTRETIIDASGNFAMSKSSYYGWDPVTKKERQRIMAAPILQDQLYPTREAAEAALKAGNLDNLLTIYVERYAVKVNFGFTPGALNSVPNTGEGDVDNSNNNYEVIDIDNNKHTLVFKPEYWAVNAYEPTTYITKSFFASNEDGTFDFSQPASFDYMNQALGSSGTTQNAWLWNSEENHRSYWAQSPSYYSGDYPRVADDILFRRENNSRMDAVDAGPNLTYNLGYYSYNQMKNNAGHGIADKARELDENGKSETPYPMIYARENTVSAKSLVSAYQDPTKSPKAAIASVVVVGRYTLDGQPVNDDEYFYITGNSKSDYVLYKSYNDMLEQFVRIGIRFAKDEDGDQMFFDYGVETPSNGERFFDLEYKKYFKIEHPDLDVISDKNVEGGLSLVIDSRFVTLQIDEDYLRIHSNERPLYAYIDGEYKLVVASGEDADLSDDQVSYVTVNKQLLSTTGTARGFKGGMAYFNIPIQHLGYYRNGNVNKNTSPNKKDFSWKAGDILSGDFGLVRNHTYNLEATGIQGLGNAIPDPDVPIVPPTDPEDYYIGARIIVLNWAIVPTQSVVL